MPILGGIRGALRIQMWDPSNIHYVLRMKLNEEKEKVNEEEYDSKDSNSSSECCTPQQKKRLLKRKITPSLLSLD